MTQTKVKDLREIIPIIETEYTVFIKRTKWTES